MSVHNCIGNPCRICYPAYAPKRHDEAAEGMAGGGTSRADTAQHGGPVLCQELASLETSARQPVPADLRECVEKAMREGVKSWPRDRGEAAMNTEAFHAAVSVCEQMVRLEASRLGERLTKEIASHHKALARLAEYREKYEQAKRHVHRWWGTGDACQCCGEQYPEHMREKPRA